MLSELLFLWLSSNLFFMTDRPRRVVLATGIYPPEVGGPATYVRSLAGMMKECGWTPIVITYGDQDPPQDGWKVMHIGRHGGVPWRYFRYAFCVWKQARTADVVYVQGGVSEGLPGTVGALLAGRGRRLIMRVPGDYAWEMHQQKPGVTPESLDTFVHCRHRGSTRMLETIERWTAKHAERVVTPSAYLKNIVSVWGVVASKIRVVYSAVPPLPSGLSREEVRANVGWNACTVLFTAVRAVPWKGVDFLLSLLEDLPETYVLCVAGDGPLLPEWRHLAHDKGLDARVRFLGRVDREVMAGWYRAADLFLLASGYEGFPHVVVEAVSTGLPCLVSDRGGNPEAQAVFPSSVQVCPYQDHSAWKTACLEPHPRLPPAVMDQFSAGAHQVMQLIDDLCVS